MKAVPPSSEGKPAAKGESSSTNTETTPLVRKQTSEYWSHLWADFRALGAGPRELWLTYLGAILFAFSLSTTAVVLVLYLSDRFGVSDIEAGFVSGMIGPLYALTCILEGSVADKMGVRFCLIFAGIVLGLARFVMAWANTKVIIYLAGLVLMPIGGGLGIPIAKYSVKKCTNPEMRVAAYSLLYIMIELGAIVSSLCIDIHVSENIELFGFGPYQLLLYEAGVASVAVALISYVMRDIEYEETGEGQPNDYTQHMGYWDVMSRAMARDQFKVLLVVALFLVFVKAGYNQLNYSLPKYMLREMGEGAHFGAILAIRPFVLAISALVFTPMAYCMSNYKLIVLGSLISVSSCFIFLLGASYWTCSSFIVVLSIGEGMWNPRLYNYAISLAPRGLEGPFVALMALPSFLSMAVAGFSSGVLLETLCPATGTRHCSMLWVVIAAIAFLTPMLMCLFARRLDLNVKMLDIPKK